MACAGAGPGCRTGSASRCRLAHSATTRIPPSNPASRRSRQSWAPLRQPYLQRRSSNPPPRVERVRPWPVQLGLLAPCPAPHRVARQRQVAGDVADRNALLVQPHHLAMRLHAPLPSLILQPLRAGHWWRRVRVCRGRHRHRCGDRSAGGGLGHRLGRSPECGWMPLHRLKDGSAAVLQQVPPVCDMDGIRRTAPAAIGVAGATVAGDDLNTGMGLQPRCKAVRLAVGQQVNDGMMLQVDEDRAVTLPSLPRPVVDPEHARRRGGRRSCPTTDEAEKGRAAHGRADPLGQAGAGFAAECQANVVLQAAQAGRPLCMCPGNSRQAFSEDALRAARPPAAQPAHLHLDLHAAALPGQVRQPAGIAAVPPR